MDTSRAAQNRPLASPPEGARAGWPSRPRLCGSGFRWVEEMIRTATREAGESMAFIWTSTNYAGPRHEVPGHLDNHGWRLRWGPLSPRSAGRPTICPRRPPSPAGLADRP